MRMITNQVSGMKYPYRGESAGHKRIAIVIAVLCSLFLVTSLSHASVGQITGTVLDEKSGEPLIGASVQVEGTGIGAACDTDGRYIIRNVPLAADDDAGQRRR